MLIAKASKRIQGYTLIEMMVVIAIMGLLTSIVLPYLPGDKQELLQDEVDRFESRIAYAQTQAVLQSQDLGLLIDGAEYRFMQRTAAAWQVLEEEPLQMQKIPEFLKQHLYIEGAEYIPEESIDPKERVPSVLFYSSGEISPFTYRLALAEKHYIELKYNPLGEVERESIHEP